MLIHLTLKSYILNHDIKVFQSAVQYYILAHSFYSVEFLFNENLIINVYIIRNSDTIMDYSFGWYVTVL
jgi:hypothetical protein